MGWRRLFAAGAALALAAVLTVLCVLTQPPGPERVAREFMDAYCAGDAEEMARLQSPEYLLWSLPNRGYGSAEPWLASIRSEAEQRAEGWKSRFGEDARVHVRVKSAREMTDEELTDTRASYRAGPGVEDIQAGQVVELTVTIKGAEGSVSAPARVAVLRFGEVWLAAPSCAVLEAL